MTGTPLLSVQEVVITLPKMYTIQSPACCHWCGHEVKMALVCYKADTRPKDLESGRENG